MGRKAVGPMCCVTHVKEPSALIEKEKGLAPVFLTVNLVYLVNPYKVLNNKVSEFISAITFLEACIYTQRLKYLVW